MELIKLINDIVTEVNCNSLEILGKSLKAESLPYYRLSQKEKSDELVNPNQNSERIGFFY